MKNLLARCLVRLSRVLDPRTVGTWNIPCRAGSQLQQLSRQIGAALLLAVGMFSTAPVFASGPVASFAMTLPSTAVAGSVVNLSVTAVDASGATVSGFTGVVSFTSNDPSAVLPASYAFQASDGGTHNFQVTTHSVGNIFVQAASTGSSAAYGTASTTVVAGPATQFAFTSYASSANAGVPSPSTVTAYDNWWNVASYTGKAVFSSSDSGATLPAPPAFTNGVANVTVTFSSAGTPSVTVADSANPSMTATYYTTVAAGPNSTITTPATVTTGVTQTASVPSQSGVSYSWTVTGGTILSGAGTNSITYQPGPAGTATISVVVTNTTTKASTTGKSSVKIAPLPVTPTITAASPVAASTAGLTASVTANPGMTYVWTISGGTVSGSTAGVTSGGINTVTYKSGTAGTITLTCVEVNAAGTKSVAASATVQAVSAPTKPTITATSPVTAGSTGLVASVVAQSGMTYAWTISGGTLTSAASGVTSGSTNAVTYTAGGAGTLTLTATASNGVVSSAAGSKSITVAAAPVQPLIAVASSVTAGQTGVTASVPAHSGMTYVWTVTGGTITSAGGTAGVTSNGSNAVTLTAGAAGTSISLTCVEVNGAGARSPAGTAMVSVATAGPPVTPTITAASALTGGVGGATARVAARGGFTYTWTISGGTITSSGGTSGVTASGTNTITFTPATSGVVILTCVESNGSATSSPASDSITIVAAPVVPVIQTLSPVKAGQSNLQATVTAAPGTTYLWSITGGTITSAGGTAGTTSGGVNSITYTAGTSATIVISCQAINSVGTASSPATATVVAQLNSVPNGAMYVFSHEDDDVLFFEPDISNALLSGRPTTLVWVTAAGSLDGAGVWQARENQSMNFTASILGYSLPAAWNCVTQLYGSGQSVRSCTLPASPGVTNVYLRLPDSSLSSLWATDSGAPFYVTPATKVKTADGLSVYARADLINVLAQLLGTYVPATLNTMDSTLSYGDDHTDHQSSALFALDAARAYGRTLPVRVFRGYSVDGVGYYTAPVAELANLSTADLNTKNSILQNVYGLDCSASGGFSPFCPRRYSVSLVAGSTGPMQSSGGCLDVSGGVLVLGACSGSATQNWNISPSGTLNQAGSCADVAADGTTVVLATCNGKPSQAWSLFSNGQLRGNENACLTVSGSAVNLQVCGPDTSQSLWLPMSTQKWARVEGPPTLATTTPNGIYTDAQVGTSTAYTATFALADVNGDGNADACIRLADGVHCAISLGNGTFAPDSLWSAAFSDANGWSAVPYGSAMMFGDINGDGRADVCGRSAAGLVCALALPGGGFGAATLWTADFSDQEGFAVSASYYGTIHLADVNGDGYADVCGRTANGVVCALNTQSNSFAPITTWISTDFTDALGWAPLQYGSTLMFGDINGDGHADVCGRGPDGIHCAVASGNAFVDSRVWSFRGDFGDAAGWAASPGYYGSLRLRDFDGDGYADVCGRASGGLVCALSSGGAFDGAYLVAPGSFTDAQGFSDASHGASMSTGDINNDGRGDFCLRATSGVTCVH